MAGLRLSLGQLFALVALFAVSLGACAAASSWTSSIAITLFLAFNCLAAAAAWATTGRARVFWLAAAVFGWAYWWQVSQSFLWTAPSTNTWRNMNPYVGSIYYYPQQQSTPTVELVPQQLLTAAEPYLARRGLAVGDTVVARWNGGGYYQGQILESNGSTFLIKWLDGSMPTPVQRQEILSDVSQDYYRTGLAAFGLFFAIGGGMLALAIVPGESAENAAAPNAATSAAATATSLAVPPSNGSPPAAAPASPHPPPSRHPVAGERE